MAPISTNASTPRASVSRIAANLLFGLLLLAATEAVAYDVETLLARDEAPFGVVFEIVDGDEEALITLLPRVRADIARIRARFPETEFAVVSHGREEFALQSRYQQEYGSLHDQVRSLVSDDIPVHVCETHASWYGVTAEDFPDYVDVAPTGPAQVAVYRELGYEVIFVD